MKEFKLKQWYPGLPENWKGKEVIVTPDPDVEGGMLYKPKYPGVHFCWIGKSALMEEDFWEMLLPPELISRRDVESFIDELQKEGKSVDEIRKQFKERFECS